MRAAVGQTVRLAAPFDESLPGEYTVTAVRYVNADGTFSETPSASEQYALEGIESEFSETYIASVA